MSASDELRAHLLVIADHTREALQLLDGGAEVTPTLSLPEGSRACTHRRRQEGMGGWETCLDCGARWRKA